MIPHDLSHRPARLLIAGLCAAAAFLPPAFGETQTISEDHPLEGYLSIGGGDATPGVLNIDAEGVLSIESAAVSDPETGDRSYLWVGSGEGNTGELNIADGGKITVNVTGSNPSGVIVGREGGTGHGTMGDGEITMTTAGNGGYGFFAVGWAGGTGTFTQSGGSVTLANTAFQVGASSGTGTYSMSGEASVSLGAGSSLFIGSGAGADGLLEIEGNAQFSHGTVDTPATQIFLGADGGTGLIHQTGADSVVTIVTDNPIHIGYTTGGAPSGASGTYRLDAGTLTMGTMSSNGVRIGESAGTTGNFIQNGGTSHFVFNRVYVGQGGAGVFTLNGGTSTFDAGLTLAQAAGSTGTLNLHGGTLEVGGANGISAGNGAYAFNLGGGTIKVTGANLTSGIDFSVVDRDATSAFTQSFIDTNGFNASLSGRLTGAGALVKIGLGTLTLSGANNLTGQAYVVGGAISQTAGDSTINYLAVGSGSGADGGYDLSAGTLDITQALQVGDWGGTGVFNQTGGIVSVSGSFNVGNQGGTGEYNLSAGTLNLSNGLYNLGRNTDTKPAGTGVFNLSGTGVLNVAGGNFVIGNRDATATTGNGTGVFNQTGGVFRIGGTTGADNLFLSGYGDGEYNLLGGTLEIGGAGLQARYGSGGTGSTYAFNLGGGTIKVINSALVTTVNASLVNGSSSTIDTNGLGANFSGAITGAGALFKTGLGALTLSGANNMGALVVQEGSATNGGGTTTVGILGVGADGTVGVFDLTGGVLNVARENPDHGDITVGGGAGGDGTLNITGGVLNVGDADSFSRFFVGAYDGTGVVNQSGGTVNTSGPFNIGNRGGHGTYSLTSGTLNVGQFPADGDSNALMLGRSRTGQQTGVSRGYLNIGGTGLLILNTNTPLLIGGDSGSDAGLSEGYVTQTGGTVTVNSWIDIGSRGYGEYNLSGGTLEIGGTSGLRSTTGNYAFNFGGGTIKVVNSDLVSGVRAGLVDGTVSTIDTNGFNATFANGFAGAGGFAKTGAGTLTLNGTTDLQAASTVSGVLRVGAGTGQSGTLNLSDNLTVTITNAVGRLQIGVDGGYGTATFSEGASFTIDDSAATSGWGTLDIGRGAGSTGVLNHSSGRVDMSGGALQIGYSGATGTYTLDGDAELVLGTGSSLFIGSGAGASGLLTIADGTVFSSDGQVFVGAGTNANGTITQTGGSATFTGTAVWFGTDSDETASTPGAGIYNLAAGTLVLADVGNGVRFGDSAHGGTGVFNQSGGTVTVTGTTLRIGAYGTYNQSGGVLEVGGANLTGLGAYNLGGGTIKVVGSTLTTGLNATLTTGRSLTIDTNDLGATFSGSLTGGGGLTKTGLGTFHLTGDSDYSGATVIEAGTFRVDGVLENTVITVASGATLAGHGTVAEANIHSGGSLVLGDTPGVFTVAGSLTLAEGSYTLLQIASLTSYDSIAIHGMFFANGILEITLLNGFNPLDGASFTLFDTTDLQGMFETLLLPVLTSGLEWNLDELYSGGILAVQASAVPEPGAYALLAGTAMLVIAGVRRTRRMRSAAV